MEHKNILVVAEQVGELCLILQRYLQHYLQRYIKDLLLSKKIQIDLSNLIQNTRWILAFFFKTVKSCFRAAFPN